MINPKLTKTTPQTSEERLFKLLEGIDWKLWEMYNMMKENLPEKTTAKKSVKKVNE
jgi:succinate dehydrogenase flavin-adding protein (antitoxin of CptAB toxin-antitoxin module)